MAPREIVGCIGSNFLGKYRNPAPNTWQGGMVFVLATGGIYTTWKHRRIAKLLPPVTASGFVGFLDAAEIVIDKVYAGYPLSEELERLNGLRLNAWVQRLLAHIEEEEGGTGHLGEG